MRYPLIFVIVLALAAPAFGHGYKQRQFVQQQAAVYAAPVMVQRQVVVQKQVYVPVQQQVIQQQVDYCPPAALAAPVGYAPAASFAPGYSTGGAGLNIIQNNNQPQRRGLFGRRR